MTSSNQEPAGVGGALTDGLLCVPAAVLVVAITRLTGGRIGWSSWTDIAYLAALGVVVGAAVGAAVVLARVGDGVRVRGVPLPGVALALMVSPAAHTFGRRLSQADGLHWGTTARETLAWAATAAVVALTLGVWAHGRWSHGWRDRLAVALLLGLLLVDRWVSHRYALLAPFTLGCAVAVLASLFRSARANRRAALMVMVGLPVVMTVAGWVMPDVFDEARRRVLVLDTTLPHIDARIPFVGRRPRGLRADLAVGGACVPSTTAAWTAPAHERHNVVIITIDTVRNDDARQTVGGREVMPSLARFMNESWQAPYAVAGYPATMMALGSAFAGVSASRLLLTNGPVPSVFGSLRTRVDDVVVALPGASYFSRASIETLITQGARRLPPTDDSATTVAAIEALRALRANHQRHLFWIHYFAPHARYIKHEGHDFGDDTRGRYRSELSATDAELGRVLKVLREEGWYDDSLVVVFSDHGESFGEHEHTAHHYHLYPWLIRVPFAMHVPGQAPKSLPPVHLADVAPTLHDFLGEAPRIGFDGVSLLGDVPADRPLISEEFPVQVALIEAYADAGLDSPEHIEERIERIERGPGYASKVAVTTLTEQLVLHRSTGAFEHYDLLRDPGVEEDLGGSVAAANLRAAYDTWLTNTSRSLGCRPRR